MFIHRATLFFIRTTKFTCFHNLFLMAAHLSPNNKYYIYFFVYSVKTSVCIILEMFIDIEFEHENTT